MFMHIDDVVAAGRPPSARSWHMGQRVAGLQRGDDALGLAGQLERLQRLGIGDRDILRAPDIVQPRMFRPDARIIEARRDRMPFEDLAILVLQQVGAVAMQHAGPTAGQAGAMLHLFVHALATGLDPDDRDTLSSRKG
jgi:hypothetical protein